MPHTTPRNSNRRHAQQPQFSPSRFTWLLGEADGWRAVDPRDLSHLTPAQARALYRTDRGLPPQSPQDSSAMDVWLDAVRTSPRSVDLGVLRPKWWRHPERSTEPST